MAAENVELVRSFYQAFNREGQAGTLPFLHPDVVWDESALPARQPGVYRGHEGILELGRQNDELWAQIHGDVEQLIDAGDGKVVALLWARGRGKFTGETVELAIAHLWEIADGKGKRVKLYLDRAAALEAASGG